MTIEPHTELRILGKMTPAERAKGRFMRAPDGHDGEAGAGASGGGADGGAGAGAGIAPLGGAAGVLGGDGAAGAGDGGQGGGDGAGAGAGGAADGAWVEVFSGQAEGDQASNRDWLLSKQFKDPDSIVKSYRELERQFKESGKVVVPGENAKPEEVAAWHKAIGVPESADGYEVKAPDGQELDTGLLDVTRAAAHKLGIPKAAYEGLAQQLIEYQGQQIETYNRERAGETEAFLRELGSQKDYTVQMANAAMRAMGWTKEDIAAFEFGFHYKYPGEGPKRTFEMLKKLGEGMAEDSLIHGDDGKQRFGVTSEEARAELDRLNSDPAWIQKVASGDKAENQRRDRLIAAIAEGEARAERRAKAA